MGDGAAALHLGPSPLWPRGEATPGAHRTQVQGCQSQGKCTRENVWVAASTGEVWETILVSNTLFWNITQLGRCLPTPTFCLHDKLAFPVPVCAQDA